MKTHIKAALFLAFFTLLLLGFSIYQYGKSHYAMSRGNYFFDNSRDNLKLYTIILDFGDGQKITMNQHNGFWRIKEADDYYASSAQAGALLKFISDTVVYRADKMNNDDKLKYFKNNIKIICQDNNGNILDIAEIAPKKGNNKYHYALLNNNSFLYQLKGNFSLSPVLIDWIQMPILQLNDGDIKRIDADNFAVFRRFSDEPFKSVENNETAMHIGQLLNNIRLLNAEKIKHITHFTPSQFQKTKHYNITLFNGIVYELELYRKDNEYWLHINLNHELLSSVATVQTVKERQILYDGWFFKINADKGYIISNFTL